jgi:ABC-type glycerol-3-phosphate transport system permease component
MKARTSPLRLSFYVFLIAMAVIYLLPIYLMVLTG